MECAGRALSFWSYQMTNQMLVPLSEKALGRSGLLVEAHTNPEGTPN
jgi:hypothetical protein